MLYLGYFELLNIPSQVFEGFQIFFGGPISSSLSPPALFKPEGDLGI